MCLFSLYEYWSLHVDDGELRRTLQSLSLGKQGTGGRVLIKTPRVYHFWNVNEGVVCERAWGFVSLFTIYRRVYHVLQSP